MPASLGIEMIQQAVRLCLMVAAPLLITSLLVGVIVSVLQAVTQIQEQTLTFIPKLVIMALVFVITMPWVLSQLIQYLVGVLRSLPTLAT
jgi:flagellar biosynthetic protein FliQ